MKLGVGSYTFMWAIGLPGAPPPQPLSALGLLEKAHGLGVRVVQYGPNLALPALPVAEVEELLSAARQYGIELEVGIRGLDETHLRRSLEFTQRCGATLLRTVPELADGRPPSLDELMVELSAVGESFRDAGVRLALENSLVPSSVLASALTTLANPFLGITLDTVNSLAIPEGTCEVAEALAPFTHCLHVKDFTVRREWHMMGFRIEGTPAGKGQLDVPWLLDTLRRSGARCHAIVELWPPEQPTLSQTIALEDLWARESITFLRTLITE